MDHTRPIYRWKLAALLLLAWASLPASAREGDVIRPYVSYGISFDDNLLRVSDKAMAKALFGSSATSDRFQRGAVGIIFDKQVSLQRFNVNLEVNHTAFDRFSTLDNTGTNMSGKWNWHIGKHLEGNIGASYVRSMGSFLEYRQLKLNMRDQRRVYADIAWLFHPSWRVRGSVASYDLANSVKTQQGNDRTENEAVVGIDYLLPNSSHVGLQYRRVHGNYPNRELVAGSLFDNSYNQDEGSLVVDWAYSGKTRIQLKTGVIHRYYDSRPERNFTGPNARVTVDWLPTGKTKLTVAAWRDIYAVDDTISTYSDNRGISIAPIWSITSKIALQGKWSYEKQDHTGDPNLVVTSLPQRKDTFRSAMIGLSYVPLPDLQLMLSWQRDERDSNYDSSEFIDNTTMLNGRYEF